MPRTDGGRAACRGGLVSASRMEDDVVTYMLHFMKEDLIPTDRQILHTAFYKVRQKYPELMERYIFIRDGPFPRSKLLESVLNELQNSHVLEIVNPRAAFYRMSGRDRELFQQAARKLFAKDYDTLIQAVKSLEGYLEPDMITLREQVGEPYKSLSC